MHNNNNVLTSDKDNNNNNINTAGWLNCNTYELFSLS